MKNIFSGREAFLNGLNIFPKLENLDFCFQKKLKMYHYTDINALIGMVQTNGIWMSNAKYLNDKEELVNALKISMEVIECIKGRKRYQTQKYQEILNHLMNKLERPCLDIDNIPDLFIASFSIKADDLSQWRAYGKNGEGVCIEFNGRLSNILFSIGNFLSSIKVTYDDNMKRKILYSMIFRYFKCVQDSFQSSLRPSEYSDILYEKIILLLAYFKHNSFKSEEEIRFVYNSINKESLKKDFENLYFRESNGTVVSYIKTNENKIKKEDKSYLREYLPISKIILGPKTNKQLLASSIRNLLDYYGYANVVIEESKLAYR